MLVPILSVLAGFVLLAGGSELLVRGATSLALLAGVSASVIGLTVVAAGTSMPELVVSVDAALAGEAEIAVGNVVGSNVFNIGAILGLAALIAPLRIVGNTIRLEWPLMLLAACQLFLMARDGSVDRIEGAFLVLALIAFCAYLVKIARSEVAPAEAEALAASLSTLPGGGRIAGLDSRQDVRNVGHESNWFDMAASLS